MAQADPDFLYRFLFEQFPVRGELIHVNAAWQELLNRADYPAPVAQVLGEALAATALLAASIKLEGRLTLQIQSEGPLSLLVVQCDQDLHLRGMASHDDDVVEAAALGPLLQDAQLVLTIESADLATRYQGMVAVEGDSVRHAIESYFEQSEQLPTRLWLAVDEHCAAGMLLQRVPGKAEDEDAWNRCVHLAETLQNDELIELEAQTLLRRLYHEEDLRLFEPRPVSFRCQCSRERIATMLRALGPQEMQEVLAQEGSVRVTCEFCKRRYEFDAIDVAQLFTELPLPHPPMQH